MNNTNRANESNDWWHSAVIYQVYPRSFCSSGDTGNGSVGNLAGVTSKLDYLADLGIDIVWVSPFFPSPMKDAGYDVSDYCNVDPLFGTLPDFDALVAKAHALNLKVMIDQVYNHTSNQHPWFKESTANATNPKSDWYVWADAKSDGTAPNNWLSLFGGPAWTWHSSRRQYYLHQFLPEQPDLNFNTPEVQEAILKVAEFWINRGIDGFRLDTVNRYVQHPDLPDNPPRSSVAPIPEDWPPADPFHMQYEQYNQGQPGNLLFLQKLRTLCNASGTILLGEIGSPNQEELLGAYTKDGDALHTGYTFSLLKDAVTPVALQEVLSKINAHLEQGWPCWGFSNHDVMRAVSRDTRVAPEYTTAYAKLLLTLLLSLRGTPCLYQGEELALPESVLTYDEIDDPVGKKMWPAIKGRDGCRTPIPWDATKPHCGFSDTHAPVSLWLPIKEPHKERAVNTQLPDPDSALNFFRAFIKWRSQQPSLCGTGDAVIERADNDVLILLRRSTPSSGAPSIRALFNFSATTQSIPCNDTLLPSPQCEATIDGKCCILPPYTSAFFEAHT